MKELLMKIKTSVKAGGQTIKPVDPPPNHPLCGTADGSGWHCPPPNIVPGPGA